MFATLARAWKPWFVYRPGQVLQRLVTPPPAAGFSPVHAAWGATLVVDPTRDIGRSLLTTGVFDLAVSECIARLLPRGGTFVDAGANVGYMSVLAARLAGPGGAVMAFEPHPELASILRGNATRVAADGPSAPIAVYGQALGERNGTADLLVPHGFGSNDGIARVQPRQAHPSHPTQPMHPTPATIDGERHVQVPLTTLDAVLAGRRVDVLKIDVEGYEPQVLAGAHESLAARRIRHIVFEDHDVQRSEAVAVLRTAGYALFALGWTMRRLRIESLTGQSVAHSYEAPNFIATADAAQLHALCTPAGWRTLRRLP